MASDAVQKPFQSRFKRMNPNFARMKRFSLDLHTIRQSWSNSDSFIETSITKVAAHDYYVEPINRKLTMDILYAIFDLLVLYSELDRRGSYYTLDLSHVCRYWRNAIISSHALWRVIDFANASVAQLYLTRSEGVPITVIMDLESEFRVVRGSRFGTFLAIQDPDHSREMQFGTVRSNHDRISSLTVVAKPTDSVIGYLVTLFSNLKLPELHTFKFLTTNAVGRFPPLFFEFTTPKLRYTEVGNCNLRSTSAFSGVVHLSLRGDNSLCIQTISDIAELLKSPRRLVHLELRDIKPSSNVGIVRLPHLRKLEIEGRINCIRHFALPEDALLVFPNIGLAECNLKKDDVLHLQNIGNIEVLYLQLGGFESCITGTSLNRRWISLRMRNWKEIVQLDFLCKNHVKDLWIEGWRLNFAEREWVTIFQSFSSLEKLVLIDVREEIFNALSIIDPAVDGGAVPCPLLTSLYIFESRRSYRDPLANILLTRAQCRSRIKHLKVMHTNEIPPPKGKLEADVVEFLVQKEGPKFDAYERVYHY